MDRLAPQKGHNMIPTKNKIYVVGFSPCFQQQYCIFNSFKIRTVMFGTYENLTMSFILFIQNNKKL